MRQALVAHARHHAAQKRGGDGLRVTFRDLDVAVEEPGIDLLALDDALNALSEVDEHLTRVMEMRYFGGFSLPEVAEFTGRSLASIKRDWAYARAWLYEHMTAVPAVSESYGG
jgi:RNA polymerase sigma factor (TIGR02999 family)